MLIFQILSNPLILLLFETKSLIFVDIPNSVDTINAQAFLGCKSLKRFEVPSSVENIGEQVFDDCDNLSYIAVSNNNHYFKSINGILMSSVDNCIICCPPNYKETVVTIPDGIEKIGEGAFINCSKLQSIQLPSTIKDIDECAFCGCESLASVIIPEGVEFINDGAFSGCQSLEILDIPSSIISIGNDAFADCNKLKEIHFRKEILEDIAYIDENLFLFVDTNNCILYVPIGTRYNYREHPTFDDFFYIVTEE